MSSAQGAPIQRAAETPRWVDEQSIAVVHRFSHADTLLSCS